MILPPSKRLKFGRQVEALTKEGIEDVLTGLVTTHNHNGSVEITSGSAMQFTPLAASNVLWSIKDTNMNITVLPDMPEGWFAYVLNDSESNTVTINPAEVTDPVVFINPINSIPPGQMIKIQHIVSTNRFYIGVYSGEMPEHTGGVESVTGNAVTGTATNPVINHQEPHFGQPITSGLYSLEALMGRVHVTQAHSNTTYTEDDTPGFETVPGGWFRIWINTTTEPSVLHADGTTPATKIYGAEFVANTDMELIIQGVADGAIEYFFLLR